MLILGIENLAVLFDDAPGATDGPWLLVERAGEQFIVPLTKLQNPDTDPGGDPIPPA